MSQPCKKEATELQIYVIRSHNLVKISHNNVNLFYKRSQSSEKSYENVNFYYKTSQPRDKKLQNCKFLL